MPSRIEAVDLARLVDEAVAAARAVQPDRDYWVFHEPPTLPVLGNPSQLLSVIESLVVDAVRATRAGQRITLRSRVERSRDAGPRAVLTLELESRAGRKVFRMRFTLFCEEPGR
jgi:signal transduction histidine kinase